MLKFGWGILTQEAIRVIQQNWTDKKVYHKGSSYPRMKAKESHNQRSRKTSDVAPVQVWRLETQRKQWHMFQSEGTRRSMFHLSNQAEREVSLLMPFGSMQALKRLRPTHTLLYSVYLFECVSLPETQSQTHPDIGTLAQSSWHIKLIITCSMPILWKC